MEKAERDAIMRQGVVLPETPRDRRERAALDADLRTHPARGRPTALRLRNFVPRADSYLAAARGPLHYMVRLHEIERRTEEHLNDLRERWQSLAAEAAGDAAAFERRWRAQARGVDFDYVNDLVARHNRWYPVESRLPMDPRTGDYVLVNGREYRLEPLDADWVLERFPPVLDYVLAAA
jgi:hypothetical protein